MELHPVGDAPDLRGACVVLVSPLLAAPTAASMQRHCAARGNCILHAPALGMRASASLALPQTLGRPLYLRSHVVPDSLLARLACAPAEGGEAAWPTCTHTHSHHERN